MQKKDKALLRTVAAKKAKKGFTDSLGPIDDALKEFWFTVPAGQACYGRLNENERKGLIAHLAKAGFVIVPRGKTDV